MNCIEQCRALSLLVFIASSVLLVQALPCQRVHCLLNPCDVSSCPAFSSGAVCSANYCGTCSAKWTMNGEDVTETCLKSSQSAASSQSSFGVTSVQSNSVQTAKLPKPASTGDLQLSDLTSSLLSLQQEGADQPCSRMRCIMDPCTTSACPAYPSSAVCSSNYCSGCSARWTLDGVDVTATCVKSAIAARLGSRASETTFQGGESESSVPSTPSKVETRGWNQKRFGSRQRASTSTRPQLPKFWPSLMWSGRQWNPLSQLWGR